MLNHELSGKDRPNTEKTGWESLEREAEKETEFEEGNKKPEFPQDELEKRERVGFAFDAILAKSLDDIIEKSCYDGDTEEGKKNPEEYVVSCALSEFLSEEDQLNMIKRHANGEPVTQELKEKFKDGIIGMAIETGMADEIVNDPLLRKRHADECAGRYAKNMSEKERDLQTILWNADKYFFGSPEAQGLLEDGDFIKHKYNVDKLVEEGLEYNPGYTEETLTMAYIDNISECLHNLTKNNKASVEDIVKDPFFRKDHFDAQYEIETKGKEVPKALAEIWQMDLDFQKSYEYGSLLFEYAKKNPEIYEKVDESEIDKLVTEALGQISDKQVAEIVKTYERNPRKGDALIAKILIPILGLENNPPTLKYGPARDKEGGYYKRSEHSVTICEDVLDKESSDEERILNATSSILDVFKPKKLEDKMFYRMGAVAHEFWHARQWGGEGIPEAKQEQYRKNFVYYMSGHSYYGAYRSQLIEAEAWAFGKKMEERCKEAYGKMRGNKK